MGTQRFEINPESFSKAADKTRHVSERLRKVWSNLDSGLTGLGSPWGTDKLGHQFANGNNGDGYTSSVTNLKDGITGDKGMANSIDNLADGQDKTAEKVRKELEDQNRRKFQPRG